MKNVFVMTPNVKMLAQVAGELREVEAGVPGMALVYGERGLGKTKAAQWFKAGKLDVVYIRAKKRLTANWLMQLLCTELRLPPHARFQVMYERICATLSRQPRLILFDETDNASWDVLETFRDIHDETDNPILFLGQEEVPVKLQAHPAFYDRLLYVEEFTRMDREILTEAAQQIFDVEFAAEVIEDVRSTTIGNFRKSVVVLRSLERRALPLGMEKVTHVQAKAWWKEAQEKKSEVKRRMK